MPRFAAGVAIVFLLVLLLLKRSSGLLFEFLLEFLLMGILRIFLYHMGTRISLNNFLVADVLCSRLLFNIQRTNEVSKSLMFQRSSKVYPRL